MCKAPLVWYFTANDSFLENLISSPIAVSKSLPRIMLYLLVEELLDIALRIGDGDKMIA